MRQTDANKKEIYDSYTNKVSTNDIINKFKISKATFFRIIKEMKDKDVNESKTKSNDSNVSINESKIESNESKIESNDNNDSYDSNNEEETEFNKEEFKKALNTETEAENETEIEPLP